jgi:pyridinium-3,5-bisthiocarboxylic acid mononucleotide nickel chelatase
MRILYFDCFSGISGDMTVGALADLGVTPSAFEWELSNLEIGECHLHFERETRKGISGVSFNAHSGATHIDHLHHDHSRGEHLHDLAEGDEHEPPRHKDHHEHDEPHEHHGHEAESLPHTRDTRSHDAEGSGEYGYERARANRSFSEISALLNNSELSPFVKKHAVSIFRRIAQAESKIQGVSIEEVQFLEIGALDSIVDVVLTCIGIEALKVDQIHFSELTDELITPTGAAIVAEFQHSANPMPHPQASKIGYGLGTRDLPDHANVLRVLLVDSLTEFAGESIAEVKAKE